MPIPFFLEKLPTSVSDNWCLITTQEITKSDDYQVFMTGSIDFTRAKLTSNRHLSCVVRKHQLQFLQKGVISTKQAAIMYVQARF